MKQYVIHIPSSKISVKNAQEVIDSAKEIGKIDVELWEGQHRDGAFRKMYEKNMRLHRMEEWENYSYLDCIVGCFMSHFSLWEESARTNERIMILEHDAIFVNEYKDYYWDGIVNIGRPLWGNWFLKDKKIKNAFGEDGRLGEGEHIEDGFYKREIDKCEKPHLGAGAAYDKDSPDHKDYCGCEKNWLVGAHSYIVSPRIAKEMVDFAIKYGILPADVFIRAEYFPMADYLPFCTYQKQNSTMIHKDLPDEQWWRWKVGAVENWKGVEDTWK